MAQGKKRTPAEQEAMIDEIVPFLQRGMSLNQACEYLGHNKKVVLSYTSGNEELHTKLHRARKHFIAEMHQAVFDGAKKDPKLALQVLERRDKKRWSPRQELTGSKGNKLFENMSEDELKKIVNL